MSNQPPKTFLQEIGNLLTSCSYALSSCKIARYQTDNEKIVHEVAKMEDLVAQIMSSIFVNAMSNEKLLFRGDDTIPNAVADVSTIIDRYGRQNAMDYFKRFLLADNFEEKMKVINEINNK